MKHSGRLNLSNKLIASLLNFKKIKFNQVLQAVTSFGPIAVTFSGAENRTSIWGIKRSQLEEAGMYGIFTI